MGVVLSGVHGSSVWWVWFISRVGVVYLSGGFFYLEGVVLLWWVWFYYVGIWLMVYLVSVFLYGGSDIVRVYCLLSVGGVRRKSVCH